MPYILYSVLRVPHEVAPIDPECKYPHPFLIHEVASNGAYALAISTKIETYYNERQDFRIYKDEGGFSTTGLDQDSFIKNQDFFIDNAHVGKVQQIGEFSGELLVRFIEYQKRF